MREYLLRLQDSICAALESEDAGGRFSEDSWERPEGGGGRTRILSEGAVFEKAGVAFSHVMGSALPPAASARRPDIAGKPWSATGVSVVLHPRNPFVPAAHANVRFLVAGAGTADPSWWFGGGFDLTPSYGFEEDAVGWHRAARDCVAPFGPSLHGRFKAAADDYFFLRHRGEARGIGGLFFDDFGELGFERSFALMKSVGRFLHPRLPADCRPRERRRPSGEARAEHQLRPRGAIRGVQPPPGPRHALRPRRAAGARSRS